MIPKFTLRQILLAIVTIAAGCAIARLPQGRLVDVPFVALSCFLTVSLTLGAGQLLRMTSGPSTSIDDGRMGGRLFAGSLLATAAMLLLTLALQFAAAAQAMFQTPEDVFSLFFLEQHLLPSDLAMLAITTALLLGQWRRYASRVVPRRQKLFDALAIACTPIVVIAYLWGNLIVWVLIYYALRGVDLAATSVNFPVPQIDSTRGAAVFARGSCAGLPLIGMHLILLAGVVRRWCDPWWRKVLLVALALTVIGEGCLLWWLAGPGLEKLTPYYRQSILVPPWPFVTVGLAILFLGSLMLTWRTLSGTSILIDPTSSESPVCWFYEHWSSSLAVAGVALLGIVTFAAKFVLKYGVLNFAYAAVQYPTNFIWVAALLAGLGTFWERFRSRREPLQQALPRVSLAQFAVTFAGLATLLLASAPILAAFTFSLILYYLGSTS